MPMQQPHPDLQSNHNLLLQLLFPLRLTRPGILEMKYCLASYTAANGGSEVDEECPGCFCGDGVGWAGVREG